MNFWQSKHMLLSLLFNLIHWRMCLYHQLWSSPPARFHAFFARVTLWHVFQPFPFPLPLCTAFLFYIRWPPSFQPRQRRANRGTLPLKQCYRLSIPPPTRSSAPLPSFLHIDYSHLGISTWTPCYALSQRVLTPLTSLWRTPRSLLFVVHTTT